MQNSGPAGHKHGSQKESTPADQQRKQDHITNKAIPAYLPSTAAHSTPPPSKQLGINTTVSQNSTPQQLDPRHVRLTASIKSLEDQIATTQAQLTESLSKLQSMRSSSSSSSSSSSTSSSNKTIDASNATPSVTETHADADADTERDTEAELLQRVQDIVTRHIRLLHRYNEIKDIGMGLMGLIADRDGRRVGEVMEDMGVSDRD